MSEYVYCNGAPPIDGMYLCRTGPGDPYPARILVKDGIPQLNGKLIDVNAAEWQLLHGIVVTGTEFGDVFVHADDIDTEKKIQFACEYQGREISCGVVVDDTDDALNHIKALPESEVKALVEGFLNETISSLGELISLDRNEAVSNKS